MERGGRRRRCRRLVTNSSHVISERELNFERLDELHQRFGKPTRPLYMFGTAAASAKHREGRDYAIIAPSGMASCVIVVASDGFHREK